MKLTRLILIAMIVLLAATQKAALAQETPLSLPIYLGEPQSDTINDTEPFDWWQIDLAANQPIRVVMSASDGLAPLIGILTPDLNLADRSADGVVDGAVTLNYTAPAAGSYIIVAARVGIESGTTSGSYTLRVDSAGQVQTESPYGAVTFRCNDAEADTLAWMRFQQPADVQFYRIRIFGADGLEPVIKLESSREGDVEPCIASDPADGISLSVPSEVPSEGMLTLTEDIHVSTLEVDAGASLGETTLLFGALNDTSGSFFVVIDGFRIDPASNTDAFDVRNGPLAARDHALLTYMVRANPADRLDPVIVEDLDAADWMCDDAGRRGCEQLPSGEGVGVQSPPLTLIGGRFDAGYWIEAGDLDLHSLLMGSRAGRTTGDYALFLIGAISPRTP